MASAGALNAIFISCLDLVLFISVMWSAQCLENISGTCQAHHYQKCEGLEKLGYFFKLFFSFLRIPHANIFQFGGGGMEKCRNFPAIFLPNLWVTSHNMDHVAVNTPQNFQGKCLQCVCRFCLRMAMLAQFCGFRAKSCFRKHQIQPLYWLIGNMLGDSVTSDKTAGYSHSLIYIDTTSPAEKLPNVID